ncbi:MAG: hypothetical protein PVF17_08815, partial [Ignavibacteria bacterium]
LIKELKEVAMIDYKLGHWIFILLLTLLCWACSSGLQKTYEGDNLSNNEIAQILCTNYIAEIIEIDGKAITDIKHSFFTGGAEIALLPGKHSLTAVFSTNQERTITFSVEAGKRYELDRWGDDAVLIDIQNKETWLESWDKLYGGMNEELLNKQIKSLVTPIPNPDDVIVRSLEHNPDVRLVSIDNKKYSSVNTGFALRLPPGKHSFEIRVEITRGFFQANLYSTMTQEISTYFEPGSIYVLYSKADLDNRTWEPVIVKDISFKYPDIEFENEVIKQYEIFRAKEKVREKLLADMTMTDLLKLFNENGIDGKFSPDNSPSPYNTKGVFHSMNDVLIMTKYDDENSLNIYDLQERLLIEWTERARVVEIEIDGYIVETIIVGNKSESINKDSKEGDKNEFKSMANRSTLRKFNHEYGYMEVFYMRDDPFFICGITQSSTLYNKIEQILLNIGK